MLSDLVALECVVVSKERFAVGQSTMIRRTLFLRICTDLESRICRTCRSKIEEMQFYGVAKNDGLICCVNCIDGFPPLVEAWKITIILDEEPAEVKIVVGERRDLKSYMAQLLDKCPDSTYDVIARRISENWTSDERLAVISEIAALLADTTLVKLDPWISDLAERVVHTSSSSASFLENNRTHILKGQK